MKSTPRREEAGPSHRTVGSGPQYPYISPTDVEESDHSEGEATEIQEGREHWLVAHMQPLPSRPGEHSLADMLPMAVDKELRSKLVVLVKQAGNEPGSLGEEECIYVRDMLLCRLKRLYALEDETVRLLTVQDLLGARAMGEGFVVSVGSADRIVSFVMDPDMHAFLCNFIYYIRGAQPGDEYPKKAFAFPKNDGSMCESLHVRAERFAQGAGYSHVSSVDIRKAWLTAAEASEDVDVVALIRAYMARTDHGRASGAGEGVDDSTLSNQWGAMRYLRHRIVGFEQEVGKLQAGPPIKTTEAKVRALLEGDHTLRPKQIVRTFAVTGRTLEIAFVQGIKRQVTKDHEKQLIQDWLVTLPSAPTRAAVRAFLTSNKLATFVSKAGQIRQQWKAPPAPLGSRREEAGRTVAHQLQVDQHIQEALASVSWPGLAVVAELTGRGRGVVTTVAFQRGQFVCHYNGNVLEGEVAKKYLSMCIKDTSVDTSYLLQFTHGGQTYCIDGLEEDQSQGRLINHASGHPNIKMVPQVVDGRPHLLFVAIRDIAPWTELLYDYGQRSAGGVRPEWLDPSFCPCPKCKGSG